MRVSTTQEKIDWLLKNQNLWEGWRSGWEFDPRKKSIVDRMKQEGLVSKRTVWMDVEIGNLITKARKQRRIK